MILCFFSKRYSNSVITRTAQFLLVAQTPQKGMIINMKKIISIISLILTIILMASCGDSNISDPSKNKSETAVASHSESETTSTASSEKLNVIVPDGWNKVEGSVLEHHYMKNTASFMVKKENFYKDNLDDVITEAKSIFQKTFDDYKDVGTENIKVAGKNAKKLIFTCNVSSISMKYMYVYLFIGGDTYAITFGDRQSTFDSLSSDYHTILNAMTIN